MPFEPLHQMQLQDTIADVLSGSAIECGPNILHFRNYSDFVVQKNSEGRKFHHVLVMESKGEHLEGNPDTKHKRSVASFFSKAGRRVSWQQLGEDFKDHIFRFQILDEAQPHGSDWRDALTEILQADD